MTLTEVEVAEKLLEFRQKQDGFIETSFDTISGIFHCFAIQENTTKISCNAIISYLASLWSFCVYSM